MTDGRDACYSAYIYIYILAFSHSSGTIGFFLAADKVGLGSYSIIVLLGYFFFVSKNVTIEAREDLKKSK